MDIRKRLGLCTAVALWCLSFASASAKDHTTIDLLGTYKTSTGSDATGSAAGNPPLHDLRVGVHVSRDVGKKLQLFFLDDPGLTSSTLGRVWVPGGFIYPSADHMNSVEYGAAFATSPNTSVRAGKIHRWTICCPSVNDPRDLAPINVEHFYYLEGSYHTRPLGPHRFILEASVRGILNPRHNVTAAYLASLPPGETDSTRSVTGVQERLGASVALDPHANVRAFGTLTTGALDFFDNAPAPMYFDKFIYGMGDRVTPSLTLTAQIEHLTQQHLGAPFPYPNAIHFSSLIFVADYKIRI